MGEQAAIETSAGYTATARVLHWITAILVLAQIVPGGDDPDAEVTGTVAARSERGVKANATIERDGRFTFRGLAPGVWSLEGRVDALRFVLPPLHVE